MLDSLLLCVFICEPAAIQFFLNVIQLVMQPQNASIFIAKGVLAVFHVNLNIHKGVLLYTQQHVQSSCDHESTKK